MRHLTHFPRPEAFSYNPFFPFQKLENEAGATENVKKNEFPIFRALAAADGVNESSAIVPCERKNLSRDNLLNSSDNLAADDGSSSQRSDVVDSSDIVLIEKASASSTRDRIQPTTSSSRDTITYETEKDIKKHQSPSSSTPLLFANNVQSYQQAIPTNDQHQQAVPTLILTPESPFKDFYDDNVEKDDKRSAADEANKQEFMVVNITDDDREESAVSSLTNPFFNSANQTTLVENQTVKDITKGKRKSHCKLNKSYNIFHSFR